MRQLSNEVTFHILTNLQLELKCYLLIRELYAKVFCFVNGTEWLISRFLAL